MWVWILSISVLGSNPTHTTEAKYTSKEECLKVLSTKVQEEKLKGKDIVGRCYYGKVESKSWW
jgi:hypothetical protein